jgi:hypothetical protein
MVAFINGVRETLQETLGGTGQSAYAAGDILYASAANTLSRLAKGSDTEVLTLASGLPSWAAAAGGGGLFDGYAIYQHTETAATNGGTMTASNDIDQKFTLNSTLVSGLGITLSSDQLTIPKADKYRILSSFNTYKIGRGQVGIYDTTGTTLYPGDTFYNNNDANMHIYYDTITDLDLTASGSDHVVEFRYGCGITLATFGQGAAHNLSSRTGINVYGTVIVLRYA